jgi:hypothetical protein
MQDTTTHSEKSENESNASEVVKPYAAFCLVLPTAEFDDLTKSVMEECQIIASRFADRGVTLSYNVASATEIPIPEIAHG